MTSMTKKAISIILLGSLMGCTASATNQDVGVVSGAAIGGLLGSRFGHGTGRMLATTGGALAGALIGGNVGRYMDKTDRLELSNCLERAPDGQNVVWTNPNNGNHYEVHATKTFYANEQPCREYVTTAIIGGKRQKVYGKACRMADGSWQNVG